MNTTLPTVTDSLAGCYQDWFLDYASYVILERALPYIEDGLKPVQRRILHAMELLEDGRYNKVANIVGATMQYHPHGDQSIEDALVNLGQKGLLIDTQGNWGDPRTGDGAAAARYIEARLTSFAKEVVFNSATTQWQASYDGRKKEPITLPIKFPLLLAQGAEGIAVGLSSKLLPHNPAELLQAAIQHLQGEPFLLLPDFPSGGEIDTTLYKKGARGGRIRVRATIKIINTTTLQIVSLPYGVTTTTLIDSILKAHQKEKIILKSITDKTAEKVNIEITLPINQSAQQLKQALYRYTDCEVSIATNACVIQNGKPFFTDVNTLLIHHVAQTQELLKKELVYEQKQKQEAALHLQLSQIFINEQMYTHFPQCNSWEAMLSIIKEKLTPHQNQFYRTIEQEDIERLADLKIKQISKYQNQETISRQEKIHKRLQEIAHHLIHLTPYTIKYYERLLARYGQEWKRQSKINPFTTIDQDPSLILRNKKLFVNRKEGFIGYGLQEQEEVASCSSEDLAITILQDGTACIIPIEEKSFVGKNIFYIARYDAQAKQPIFNMIYTDLASGITRAKRFQINAFTRGRSYLLAGAQGRVHYLTALPEERCDEEVEIILKPTTRARKKKWKFNFTSLDIKGRTAQGNLITRYPIKKIKRSTAQKKTLYWYNPQNKKINTKEKGIALGTFTEEEKIIIVYKNGFYVMQHPTEPIDPQDIALITRHHAPQIITLIYKDRKEQTFVKRIQFTKKKKGKAACIPLGSNIVHATVHSDPKLLLATKLSSGREIKKPCLIGMLPVVNTADLGHRITIDPKERLIIIEE